MRKRIAIFGGSLFQDIRVENNSYILTGNNSVLNLKNAYNIDNYSVQGLTAERALRLIKTLPIKEMYNDCIIALGENDIDCYYNFNKVLDEILDYLLEANVRPILVSLSKEYLNKDKAHLIQKIIDNQAIEKNVDYIYEGETEKTVSYIVKDNCNIEKAILALC